MKEAEEQVLEKQGVGLSAQPFWQARKTKRCFLKEPERGENIAVLYELDADPQAKGLYSVPGIGLLGVQFSLDQECPSAMVCGLLTQTKEVPLYGTHHTLLCQFFPGRFTQIFGIPCSAVTDTEAPLEDFIQVGSLYEELAAAADMSARQALLQQFIGRWQNRSRRNAGNERLVPALMEAALRKHGLVQLHELEQETGYSSRYLQTIIREKVGVSPKIALNNMQFQDSLQRLLRDPDMPLASIAQASGYYDQSYFTRKFKEYMGVIPAVFAARLRQVKQLEESI